MKQTDTRLLLLNAQDTILVLMAGLEKGENFLVEGARCRSEVSLPMGHKIARRDISRGEQVLKYGLPIGVANASIARGAHVHVHNLTSGYTAVENME